VFPFGTAYDFSGCSAAIPVGGLRPGEEWSGAMVMTIGGGAL